MMFLQKIGDVLNAFSEGDEKLSRSINSVIIVAAGSGTRMANGYQTKQMMNLNDMPVVARTIQQFEDYEFTSEIIVVARTDEMERYDIFREQYGWKKPLRVVSGGNTRQESVLAGLEAIREDSTYVAIHDAARCLITPEMIRKVFRAAVHHDCATAAAPAKDTFKLSTPKGFIEDTPDRSKLWHAQTPQIFRTDIYRAAAYVAKEKGLEATDDCMLVESIGHHVKLVDCGHENIKLTHPEDTYIAEAILRLRQDKADEILIREGQERLHKEELDQLKEELARAKEETRLHREEQKSLKEEQNLRKEEQKQLKEEQKLRKAEQKRLKEEQKLQKEEQKSLKSKQKELKNARKIKKKEKRGK